MMVIAMIDRGDQPADGHPQAAEDDPEDVQKQRKRRHDLPPAQCVTGLRPAGRGRESDLGDADDESEAEKQGARLRQAWGAASGGI